MLVIHAKGSAPLLYTLETIFSQWLELDWRFVESNELNVKIEMENHEGFISFPNILFEKLQNEGLTIGLVPGSEVVKISRFNFLKKEVIDPDLPILYGRLKSDTANSGNVADAMLIDIFGSVFFMLSRLEEVVSTNRDSHDRFHSKDSVAVLHGFIDRPIVDEYVEVLWGVLASTWPSIERKTKMGQTIATCDIDRPFEYPVDSRIIFKQFVKELFNKESPTGALHNLIRRSHTLFGNFNKDLNINNVRWMMAENEKHNKVAEFNFVAGTTDQNKDPFYKISDKPILHLLKEVDERGHKIGIHPSYNTYLNVENMIREVTKLGEVLNSLDIKQKIELSRQHFLRWKTPNTIHTLIESGVTFDSSMGYAEKAGFRSGTAKQYYWFDLFLNETTRLIERPLIFMECSVLSSRYMDMNYSDQTLSYILKLKERALKYGGDFVFLWHDYYFYSEKDNDFYSEIVK